MTLPPGTRLGPYEIAAAIGAGGMGQVYRAHDPRLGRDVAVKVVPPGFASDPARVQRFEQEARAAAALNHPNICQLFDVGHEGGAPFLVMELLEGESLRERLRRGAMPARRAVEFAVQVAYALAAAHEKGIVHRDLKPENLFVGRDGRAKVLDFGLAKLLPSPPGGVLSHVETAPGAGTEAGAVLGTVGYMAPEQVRGEAADPRADIFALGAVLAESLTGHRTFPGGSFVEIGHAILNDEPRLEMADGAELPGPVRRILQRCLEKRPEQRFQSVRDLAFALEATLGSQEEAGPGTARRAGAPRRAATAWVVVALLAGFAAAAWLGRGLAPAAPVPRAHFQLAPPRGTAFEFDLEEGIGFAVSPDGSRIAFAATDSVGVTRAWLRALADREASPLPGTEGAYSFTWSPDGRSLGFFAGRELKRYDLATGGVVSICTTPSASQYSGSWGSRGTILMAATQEGVLYEVAAAGGTPRPLPASRDSAVRLRAVWPRYLPDGRRFVFLLHRTDSRDSLVLGSPGGRYDAVMPVASRVEYADAHTLLSVGEGTLLAQPVAGPGLGPRGAAVPVAPGIGYFSTTGGACFSVSPAGVLAYQPAIERAHLAWIDRRGEEIARVGSPADYLGDMSLSHDGSRLLTSRRRPGSGTWDVWSLDLAHGTESRLTTDAVTEAFATWLPGDRGYVYGTTVLGGAPRLASRDLASGRVTAPAPGTGFQMALDVSRDGKWLLYAEHAAPAPGRLFARRLEGGAPVPFVTSPASPTGVQDGRFSPDARAVSFIARDGDRDELFVSPFPGPGERIRVSTAGALMARWSRDGREIDYVSPDGHFMAAAVGTAPALRVGTPRLLFRLGSRPWKGFVVAPDGRFLAVVPDVVRADEPLDVIVGWRPPR